MQTGVRSASPSEKNIRTTSELRHGHGHQNKKLLYQLILISILNYNIEQKAKWVVI